MFRGDDGSVRAILTGAFAAARSLDHPRVGSEHLLLALSQAEGPVAAVLTGHGASAEALRDAVRSAAPHGAGMAADRQVLAPLGVALALTPTEQPVGRPPLFPLGTGAARRRLARCDPPLGADAQAACAASLRLALARRERAHRAEHLALTLVCLDPGAAWTLAAAGVDRAALLADLAAAFPAAAFSGRARLTRRTAARRRQLVRRYQQRTGRTVVDGAALAGLLG